MKHTLYFIAHRNSQDEGKKNTTTADHLYRGLDHWGTPLSPRKVSPAFVSLLSSAGY